MFFKMLPPKLFIFVEINNEKWQQLDKKRIKMF